MKFIESNFLPNSVYERAKSSIDWSIYPSPADSFITLNIPKMVKVYQIQLVDVTGRIIMNVNPNQFSIDVSNINSGLFYFVLTTDKGVLSKSITIQ
jgi:hypothetical protein